MTIVPPMTEFEVPWWLGGFIATTNETADWMLPLTYLNGGKTNAGTTLVIQNRGPYNITLYAQSPETIQGLGTYLVVADSTISLLAAQDWIVVSSTFGDEGTDGNFGYLQAENVTASCQVSVSVDPVDTKCGTLSALRIYSGQPSDLGWPSESSLTASTKWSSLNPAPGNLFGVFVQNSYAGPGNSTGNIIGAFIRGVFVDSTAPPLSFNNIYGIQVRSMDTSVNTISQHTAINVFGVQIQTIQTSGMVPLVTNQYQLDIVSPARGSAINVMIRLGAASGGTTNYGIWFNSNTADPGAGICSGTAGDACLFRAAANRWTFNTGTSLSVPNYLNVGSGAAPTNTATGSISTTNVTPTLQAFGAVTANAASGLLSFTVSTAANTCATATITNTNVVAGSQIQLTIQGYTGTLITNGLPAVSRLNTAGSSTGSFILSLCNTHASNALSGNLYVGFWVLN